MSTATKSPLIAVLDVARWRRHLKPDSVVFADTTGTESIKKAKVAPPIAAKTGHRFQTRLINVKGGPKKTGFFNKLLVAVGTTAYPAFMIGVAFASWTLRPPSRRLA